jgi:hypothetical protein
MKLPFALAALVAVATLSGCVVAPAPASRPYYYDQPVMVAPPPARVEYVGPPPVTGYIWTGGYWSWSDRHYDWVPGRWAAPRPGYSWTPHRWEQDGQHWRQTGGQWERHDDRHDRREDYRSDHH